MCACLAGFRGPPKAVVKDKEKEKDKEPPAKSESSHELPLHARTERAKWCVVHLLPGLCKWCMQTCKPQEHTTFSAQLVHVVLVVFRHVT